VVESSRRFTTEGQLRHADREDQEEHEDPEVDLSEEDEILETDVEVTCPYCGETVSLSLDPGGGHAQEYVEDCPVCCRPWQVHVQYGAGGSVEVTVEASGE
jgi:predicted RNA-binding Zn-ribbon protein involved in translation (DUF1610 family)